MHHRHDQVQQHDIGPQMAGSLEGFLPVRRFAHDVELGIQPEEHAQPLAHHAVIVDHQDPDRHSVLLILAFL